MEYDSEHIYRFYLRAKSEYFNFPYKVPEKFPPDEQPDKWVIKKKGAKRATRVFDNKQEASDFIKKNKGKGYRKSVRKGKKMPDGFLGVLEILAKRFNTRWSFIDPKLYFDCGFSIFGKRFVWNVFTDPKIMKLYIQKDKNKKRFFRINKKNLIESLKFVKKYIDEQGITFDEYCRKKIGYKNIAVIHYVNNDIDHFFLTWLISDRYIILTDGDKSVIPYILDNYRASVYDLKTMKRFMGRIKEKVESWN